MSRIAVREGRLPSCHEFLTVVHFAAQAPSGLAIQEGR
jgi:hypothetical protein